jgi:hypothetical protein
MPAKDAPQARKHRRPTIGEGQKRDKQLTVQVNRDELAALDELVLKRRCGTRGDLIRLYLEQDNFNQMVLLDDALHNLAIIAGQAIGGAVAELAAKAELYALENNLSRRF